MSDLNPLKFQVAIQDDATQKLNDIESKLNSLKDQQITVSVHGLEDLRSLLTVLQHQMVNNLGNNVSQGISDALRSMQTEAQAAIRQSLSDLSANLATIKEAIQHDNFTAFGKRIGNCADEVNRLNEAFEKFHITIGKDDGLKNFMTGLGEVIRNVRQTMGQLHGNDPGYNVSPDALTRSINVAKHETERLNTRLTETQRTIETFSDKGFNTARLERYKSLLIDVRDNLSLIEKNGGVHPLTGLTASQYLRSEDASRVTSLLNNELSYYKSIGNELERIAKLRGEINSLLSTPGINGGSRQELSYVLSGLDLREGLFGRLGVRDAFQSINTDAYREQMQQAVGVISRVNSEIRQGVRDSKAAQTENEKWAKSVDDAKKKITDLEMKIASLEAVKKRGDFLHVDTSSLTAYIAEMKNLLTIMRSIEAGMKIHGTAESFASSAGYRNTWKLADAEAGVVKKNSDEKEKNALATQRLNDAERQLALSLKSTTQEMRGQSQMLSDLKSLATQYLGVWGGQQFLNNIIKIGGQLESQRLSLTAILGQRSYANDLFDKVQDLALKSPFGVVQLDQYSKNLSAFGFQYNELFDMTKRLADIAAGTGTDFGRLALALGHVRSEMALTGYTLRQFSMANVPMLKMLAENLGVTTAEIRKMVREKKVSYEDVEKVLKDLTDEGGMFYNMQEVMSEAVSAKFKNLKDAMDIMYGQMAESVIGDMLKGIAATLTEVTKRWQTFGTVLMSTALIIGAYKMYMHLLNVGVQKNTINLLQNAAATKALTAADIEQMLEKKLLTAQDIALALAEGRLTVEQAQGALVAAGYTEAIVAEIAATRGLTGALAGLKASSAGMVGFLTNPWTAALLAVEAVIGAIMAYNTWSSGIEDDVNRVLERAKTASEEIGKYLMGAEKEGKPVGEQDLSEEIEQMKTILKNSELYTEELSHQVDLAPSLSDEYDILIGKMQSVNDELSKSSINVEAISEAIKHTSGDFMSTSFSEGFRWMFNDDIFKNLEQLEKSRGKFVSMMGGALDQYRDKMQEITNAIATQEQIVIKNGNSTTSYLIDADIRAKLLNKSLEEQLRILSSNGNESYWNLFIRGMNHASSDFSGYADDMKKRLDQMNGDFSEILEDDIPRMMEKLWTDKGFHSKEEFRKWANENTDSFSQMLTDIEKILAEKAPSIAGMLRGMLTGWLNGNSDWTLFEIPQMLSSDEQEKMRQNLLRKGFGQIGDNAKKTLNTFAKSLGKSDNFFDNDFISKFFKRGDDASGSLDAMGKRLKELNAQIEANKKVGHKTPQEILDEKERLDVANKLWKFEKDRRKIGGHSNEDKEAKRLRERVRILKEAADSYQYWREKVGDEGAGGHVNAEFGKLLGELGFSFDKIETYRETLRELRKEYEKKPQTKAMLEALKELDKEIAQLDRKDFEKGSEEFLSRMKENLDSLTLSWDIFNNVVETTGDRMLAMRMSGIAPGATPADLKRTAVSAFSDADIDFDKVLGMSDNEIDEYVYQLGVLPVQIKGIQDGLKEWKKAQQEVLKSDIQSYAKWLGGLVDLQTIQRKNQEEYNRALEETNRLLQAGLISPEQANARNVAAWNERVSKDWESSVMYSRLYNNSRQMARSEFDVAYQREVDNLNQKLKDSKINTQEWSEALDKLNKIKAELGSNGFLGIGGGVGAFLGGGYEGLIAYHRDRAKDLNEQGNTAEAKREYDKADAMQKAQKAAEQVAKTFQDLASGADLLSNMFQALGYEHTANAFGDVAGVFSGIAGGAQSLSGLGPWGMAAGAAIGGITAVAQLHDKNNQRHIEALQRNVRALEANTDVLKMLRSRTYGYDNGRLNREFATMYRNGATSSYGAASKAMSAFYGNGGSGYAQELRNLEQERKDYLSMYNEEEDKKNSSSEALLEYKQKIAELDEQIRFFTEDLAKELWDIDIKGWADQIGDALMSAFENGENAAKAYEDTVKSIMQSVASNILKIGILEPMMERLNKLLFGYTDERGQSHSGTVSTDEILNNPAKAAEKMIMATNEYFASEGKAMITAAREFYVGLNDALEKGGLKGGLFNSDNGNTLSSSIQGTSEETSGLLAGYVNALRQDVGANRLMLSQFVAELWPSYIEQVTSVVTSVKNIDQNVDIIRTLLSENGAIYVMIDSMKSHLDNITNGNESVAMK